MARTTNGIEEALTILEIYKRIPRRFSITSLEIQDALADAGILVKERTLQRYLKAIAENEDFGVECDMRSRPYGYRLSNPRSAIHKVELTPTESLLMRLAQEHLRYKMPRHMTESLNYLFDKATEVLQGTPARSDAKREAAWLKKLYVTPQGLTRIPAKVKPRIFDAVSEALFACKKLDIQYVNSEEKKIARRVMPLGLVEQEGRLYLVCQIDNKENYRHLALHRMNTATVIDIVFDYPADFTLAQYVKERHFNFTDGEKVQWTVVFTEPKMAKNLTETPFNETQTITKRRDGCFVMSVIVDDSIWLKGWVATYEDVAGIKKYSITKLPPEKHKKVARAMTTSNW